MNCEHHYGVARCRHCGAKRPRTDAYSNTGLFYTVVPTVEPVDEITADFLSGWDSLGAYAPRLTVSNDVANGQFDNVPSQTGWRTRQRYLLDDGTRQRLPDAWLPKPIVRAPMGEMDRDFLNQDLTIYRDEADSLDEVTESLELGRPARSRVTEFHDLLAHMNEVPVEDTPTVTWNQTRDETDHWVPQRWTRAGLADRLCRFEWNEHYWDARRVPQPARAGRLHTGRFVYMGDGVFATVVVKWFDGWEVDHHQPRRGKPRPVWKYTVFWRESLGYSPRDDRGRSYRVWAYHYSKTFRSAESAMDAKGHEREGALAFADRLEAKARLEADLIADDLRSLGRAVPGEWDRDEFAYDPAVLIALAEGGGWSDEL